MEQKLVLHSYFRSSCAYRVRIGLNLKTIPYDVIPVHLLKDGGQQYKGDYVRLNPSKQVPTLIDGEFTLGQSMAILEYLNEEFPTPPLLPQSNSERAIVRQMCEIINSGIQPLQNLSVTQSLEKDFSATIEQRNTWVQSWIKKGLESFESLLEKHSGKYCFGDQITLADCLLVPQIFSSARFGIDTNAYPKCVDINQNCLQLTAFKNAAPERQPDFEPNK